ncbi:MAG: TIGR03750 family conjugal transfer protein [Prolixibacteraceae bacterium]|nr:TIGR03750 family conjugal transfer protein [Prolixibacteraceae bacterium]
MHQYSIYKGLQKPLVFKGFKGRYMYWAIGFIILGIVLAAVVGTLLNFLFGAAALIVTAVGGIIYTSQRQKGGLYDKTKSYGIYILRVNLRGNRNVKEKNI